MLYAHRDFVGRLPFGFGGFVDLKRDYYGLGTAMEYQPQKTIACSCAFTSRSKDHRQRFKNLNGSSGKHP